MRNGTKNQMTDLIAEMNKGGNYFNDMYDGEKNPEWKLFGRSFKRIFKNYLKEKGAFRMDIDTNYFFLSGFFQMYSVNGPIYYFSMNDLRYTNERNLMIRKAENFMDYRGGSNNWLKMNNFENFDNEFVTYIAGIL